MILNTSSVDGVSRRLLLSLRPGWGENKGKTPAGEAYEIIEHPSNWSRFLKCLYSQWKLSSFLLKLKLSSEVNNIDRCILQVLVNVASDTKHVKNKNNTKLNKTKKEKENKTKAKKRKEKNTPSEDLYMLF